MERLTFEGNFCDIAQCRELPCPYGNSCSQRKVWERLKEYEDAEADGRLVVLPCKDWLDIVFGEQSTFWCIDKDYIEEPIREISVDNAERIGWYDGYNSVFLKGTEENGQALEFTPDEIGKTVFLTREEAEKALEAGKDG